MVTNTHTAVEAAHGTGQVPVQLLANFVGVVRPASLPLPISARRFMQGSCVWPRLECDSNSLLSGRACVKVKWKGANYVQTSLALPVRFVFLAIALFVQNRDYGS